MKQRIDIDTRTFVRFWLVVIGFGVAALAIFSARHALLILGVSVFLALALNVPVSKLSRRLPGKSRVGATALAYAVVVIALGAVLFLVVPPIVQQTAKFIQNVPSIVDNAGNQWNGLKGVIDQYHLQPQVDKAVESLKASTSSWASNVGQTVIDGVGSVFGFIASLILILVLTFLMLIEAPIWMKRLWNVYNNKERMESHKRVVGRMYGVITGYITGQLTVSAIAGTCAGLVVCILSFIFPTVSISLALPTAAIAFLFSLIPLFGSTIGGVLIAGLLALNSVPAGIIYFIYIVIYMQVEGNFISPNIQARKIDLSPLAILASITVGVYMFGIAGAIIAIPIAGCIRVLLEEYLAYNKKHHAELAEHDA